MTPAKFAESRAEQAVRYARKEKTSLAIAASVFRVDRALVEEAAARLEKTERAAHFMRNHNRTSFKAALLFKVDQDQVLAAYNRLFNANRVRVG